MVARQGEGSGLGESTSVGRSQHTNPPSSLPWAAALQRPSAALGPARRAAPPPPSPQRAPPRHHRRAPGDAAAARAGLPRPESRRAPPRPSAAAQLSGAPLARPPPATCALLPAHAAPRSTTSCSATAPYRFQQRHQRCPQPRAPRHHCRCHRPR
jgi:hypothetical protein